MCEDRGCGRGEYKRISLVEMQVRIWTFWGHVGQLFFIALKSGRLSALWECCNTERSMLGLHFRSHCNCHSSLENDLSLFSNGCFRKFFISDHMIHSCKATIILKENGFD